MNVLFAVDGSAYTVKAAEYMATHFKECPGKLELHLLNVHLPIPRGLALVQAERLFGGDVEDHYYKEEAQGALAPAEQILRAHHIPFTSTYKVGDIAEEIIRYASENGVDLIVMGSHGHGAIKNLMMGSIATKVLAMASIPVLIVR